MDETIPAQAVVVAVLVLVLGGGVAGTSTVADTVSARVDEPGAATIASTSDNGSIGPALTEFMQVTTVETGATVDSGLFAARFDSSNPSRRAMLVRHRTAALRARLDELRQERTELVEATANDTVSIRERARAARLAARIAMLQRSINETEAFARRAGVRIDDAELDRLRNGTRTLQRSELPGFTPGQGDGIPANQSTPPGLDHAPRPDGDTNRSDHRSGRETNRSDNRSGRGP